MVIWKRTKQFVKKHWKLISLCCLVALLWYAFCLPRPLFKDPVAMVIEDRQGQLLGARIAEDGQWRFPEIDSVPDKFAQALILFEDKRFYSHPGVDVWSLGRALWQNIRSGSIESGGSTLTMQVVRLFQKRKKRTIGNKLIEIILATRLDLGARKDHILRLYASHAPFGGNVVGLEAASWRYFGKSPYSLSWAESAMLAVLPNAPALIHPGRNRNALKAKRDRLLHKLHTQGFLDDITLELAMEEPIPQAPTPLPQLAPHLLDRLRAQQATQQGKHPTKMKTSIDYRLQEVANRILDRHQRILRHNGIHNAAALILDIETGEALAYVGNVTNAGADHGAAVDVIPAPRSTGSILKPFLYSLMLSEGQILPNTLVKDIPTLINGYQPQNFYEDYDGAVPAGQALTRSLNIPFVHLLHDYGLEKFHHELQELGLQTITQAPDHYGLTLILGGAEGRLEDITGVYAGMARVLNHYSQSDGEYLLDDFRKIRLQTGESVKRQKKDWQPYPNRLSAGAIWHTFKAMQALERPGAEGQWERFSSSRRLAWKTGTSFGFRDAWAVGVDTKYAVGVWVGNADGEGRPGLIGVKAAAPILFELFDQLPAGQWFEPPLDDMVEVAVCQKSGYRASPVCPADSTWIPRAGLQSPTCPFHEIIHLDKKQQYRVHADCVLPSQMVKKPWFVLPPIEASYYQYHDPDYRSLPDWMPGCAPQYQQTNNLQIIYPKPGAQIYIPVDLNGEASRLVLKAAHRSPRTTVFWHLDQQLIGSTQHFHEMELLPEAGRHQLTLVDEYGERKSLFFEITNK
jgi:penicillin-binding protein 1C